LLFWKQLHDAGFEESAVNVLALAPDDLAFLHDHVSRLPVRDRPYGSFASFGVVSGARR